MGAIQSAIRVQPFKALYLSVVIPYELLRLPLFLIYYALPFNRPHKQWTLNQAFMVHLVKSHLYHSAQIEVHISQTLEPGKEGDQFRIINPAPANFYQGPLKPEILAPEKIGGTWYPSPYPLSNSNKEDELVVLQIHGGAFVIGNGRKADCGFVASNLIKQFGANRVFCPQYRLASWPNSQFPAAIQDTLTSYYYLTHTLKIPASRIVLAGDSAGGNIVLTFLRYMAEFGDELDLEAPSAALLHSPWADIKSGADKRNIQENPNYPTDYLNGDFGAWGARCYAKGHDQSGPWISPLGHAFKTMVPLWVQTGSAEVLYEENLKLVKELEEVGNQVTCHVAEAAPHDIALVGGLLGFADEFKDCAKRAGIWYRGLGR